MARVTSVSPDHAEGEAAEAFSEQMRQFGRVSNFYRVLANSPSAMKAWTVANRGVRIRYLSDDIEFLRIEQMVIVRTSALNGSEYCLGHNVDLSREIGITDEQLSAVQGDYAASPLLEGAQKAAIRWADAVTKFEARDDPHAFEELRKHFSDRQIVELTILIGMWNYSNRLTEALHVNLEPVGERLNFFHGHSDTTAPAGGR